MCRRLNTASSSLPCNGPGAQRPVHRATGRAGRCAGSGREDEQTRAVVITGSRKAFAAGADIREMAERDLVGILNDPRVAHWQSIAAFAKPLIAAVNGYALGGGCELVMCADIVIAGSDARFGQPKSTSASSPVPVALTPAAGSRQSRWPCKWC